MGNDGITGEGKKANSATTAPNPNPNPNLRYSSSRFHHSPHSLSPSSSSFPFLSFITFSLLLHLLLLSSHPVIATPSKIDDGGDEAVAAAALLADEQQKRAGGRGFNFAPDERKRGGARAFAANFAPEEEKRAGGRAFAGIQQQMAEKRGGARAFHGDIIDSMSELKRAGGRGFQLDDIASSGKAATQFNFAPDERKRGGARPFYGGGYMDGAWKRAGGRYFMRAFDDGPFSGWAVKRGGGHRFASLLKRGGGRSFFGGVDALFDNANYWAPQRYIAKYRRSPASELEQRPASPSAPFYYGSSQNWEKGGGGRSFSAE